VSISIHNHVEAHHLVEVVALLEGKVIESFGTHASVVLKECIRVLLQVLDPLPTLLEGGQFSAGFSRAASFVRKSSRVISPSTSWSW